MATPSRRPPPPPVHSVSLPHGTTARVAQGGRIQSIHTKSGVTINRTAAGQRTIVTEHRGRTFVNTGRGAGYMQRNYTSHHGNTYVQRTYVVNGHTDVYVYNTRHYRGLSYYSYVPAYRYRPVFYGWAYDPWVRPVYYHWGWNTDPWYAPYSYYFAPAPYYPVASLWLTDFLLARSLQSAFQAGADAGTAEAPVQDYSGAAPAGATVLSPEIKQMIAEEVRRQLDADRAAAGGAPPAFPASGVQEAPPALDPATRVYVVFSSLDVIADDGGGCTLTPGDIITRIADSPDENQNLAVLVTTSKRADCPMGQRVAVSLPDLQEMHNHFREQIDSGLRVLAENQGRNGLPPAPDTRTLAGEVPPPTADQIQDDLQRQQFEADQAEADVRRQVGGG